MRELLGLAEGELVDGFVDALASGDAAAGIDLLDRLEERGRDLRVFLDQVVDALRARLLAGLASRAGTEPAVAAAARRLAAIDPTRLGAGGLRLQLELALFASMADGVPATRRAAARRRRPWPDPRPRVRPPANPSRCRSTSRAAGRGRRPRSRSRRVPRTPGPRRPPAHRRGPASTDAGVRRRRPRSPRLRPRSPRPEPARATAAPLGADAPAGDDLERLRRGWTTVVTTITERNRAAKPLISACRPIGVEGNVVTLGFPEEQGFLKDVAERRRPLNLEDAIGEFLGHDVGVRCVATNLDLVPPLPDDAGGRHVLAEAQRIFAEDRLDVPEVT